MAIEAIVIKNDPVTIWESYNRTFSENEFAHYSHARRAMAGFYRCDFEIGGSLDFLTSFFFSALGRHIEAYNYRGKRVWEGKIFDLDLRLGGFSQSITLNTLANKVWVRYYDTTSTDTERGTVFEDADSQSRYGIRETILSGGDAANSENADQAAEVYLARVKDPGVPTFKFSGVVRAEPVLRVGCRGYWDTLFWRVYNQTGTTGLDDASDIVSAIITDMGDFVGSTNIETNDTQIEREMDADRFGGDIITSIAELGDTRNNRWIAGFDIDREFYYREASLAELP